MTREVNVEKIFRYVGKVDVAIIYFWLSLLYLQEVIPAVRRHWVS